MLLYETLANSILLVSTLISILFNITMIIIHVKQPLLREEFFDVVFHQIILELLINISIFFQNFFYLIFDDKIGKWFMVFPIIFNFAYEAIIVYNIRIIIFLFTFNKEDLIDYDKDTDFSKNSELSKPKSVSIVGISLNNFHYISFGIATIHTILYICNLVIFQKDIEIQSENWAWYYYYLSGKNEYWQFFFFICHITFFILSFIYFIKSCNKDKISNHIYLKSYSCYCLFSSLISLFIPISLLVFIIINADENKNDVKDGFLITLLIGFLFFLLATTIFRLKNYYVNFILSQGGKGILNWLKNIFGILFCKMQMEEVSFVDLNSAFIYQALSSSNDLIIEGINNSELVQSSQKEETND